MPQPSLGDEGEEKAEAAVKVGAQPGVLDVARPLLCADQCTCIYACSKFCTFFTHVILICALFLKQEMRRTQW